MFIRTFDAQREKWRDFGLVLLEQFRNATSQALVIRPDRMQLVHTRILLGVLPTITRTRWRLGFHRRFVRLWA